MKLTTITVKDKMGTKLTKKDTNGSYDSKEHEAEVEMTFEVEKKDQEDSIHIVYKTANKVVHDATKELLSGGTESDLPF